MKKPFRFEYDDEDQRNMTKKKLREEKQKKSHRNLKNQFRSKSFDVDRFTSEFED